MGAVVQLSIINMDQQTLVIFPTIDTCLMQIGTKYMPE